MCICFIFCVFYVPTVLVICFIFVAVQVCHDVPGGAVVARGDRFHRAVFTVRAAFDLVLLADRRQHQLCVHIRFRFDVSAVVHQPPAEERVPSALEGIVASI